MILNAHRILPVPGLNWDSMQRHIARWWSGREAVRESFSYILLDNRQIGVGGNHLTMNYLDNFNTRINIKNNLKIIFFYKCIFFID
jgi:hypothetical protein